MRVRRQRRSELQRHSFVYRQGLDSLATAALLVFREPAPSLAFLMQLLRKYELEEYYSSEQDRSQQFLSRRLSQFYSLLWFWDPSLAMHLSDQASSTL